VSPDQKTRVQDQFGATAAAYVASSGHAGGADLERLVAWGRELRPARVLDVATGGGHTALAFAAFAPIVVATDLTRPMLEAARGFVEGRRPAHAVRFVAADVEALPFPDESFAVVTCRIAAHHFPEPLAAARQVARVLVPGGSFLLQDIVGHDDPACAAFILEVEKRRDPSHVRAYSRREWLGLMQAVGLTVIDEAVVEKVRPWEEWTARTRMAAAARSELDRFVLAAPPACRAAFAFRVEGGRIASFTDRMLLLRADRRDSGAGGHWRADL
jgi:ubiquinone/menaquinone biosynthesis C-methylase UbiE